MAGDDTNFLAQQQVVFIDSDVPDIQDLLSGLAPGEQAFVLDGSSDGLQQIAAILAANNLTNLASISIVGHGSSGEIDLGSTVLDQSSLSNHAAALAQIGAALAPDGDIALYACDTAAGAAGQQFIADLSQYAGGADVAAATQAIGSADLGGSWTLDASSGAPVALADSPFTAQAEASFDGILGNTLTAVQSSALKIDVDGDGVADPGDTVTVTAQITNNSASTAATGVTFSETLSGLTFVGGSLAVTPIAVADSYSLTGNIPLTVSAGSGVLANDISPDGGALTATSIVQSDGVTHGTVALNSDGSFTYTPDTGYAGTATFQYTAHDADGGNSNQTGAVTLTVGSPTWYVNASNAGAQDGTAAHPFTTIEAAVTAAAAATDHGVGDTISVAAGSYSGAGITLASGEKLVGAGSGTTTFTVSSGNAVTLNSGNTISGIAITDSGSGASIIGTSVGTLHLANVAVTSGSGAGISLIQASLGGSVDATGTNTISSTTGTALDVTNVNIGSSNLTFQSISDAGSSTNAGIILNNTGSSGGLIVTGTGSAGSGGTIANKTGSDILTGTDAGGQAVSGTNGVGIFLENTTGASFTDVNLHDFSNFAIYGNTVTGFTLANSAISGTNGSTNAGDREEDSVRFDNLLSTTADTASITGSSISGGYTQNVDLYNTSGTLARLTLDNDTFGLLNSTGGNDNVALQVFNSAIANISLTNSDFLGTRSDFFAALANNNSTMAVIASGNTFHNGQAIIPGGGTAIDVRSGSGGNNSAAHTTFDITNNTLTDGGANAFDTVGIFVAKGEDTGTLSGTIAGNSIGPSKTNSNSDGIFVREAGNSGSLTTLIQNNTITGVGDSGIALQNNDGGATMNATLYGNTVSSPTSSFPFAALDVENGATSTDTSTTNIVVGTGPGGTGTDNTLTHNSLYSTDVELSNFGSSTHLNLSKNGSTGGTAQAVITADNNGSPSVDTTGGNGTTTLVTTLPTTPPPLPTLTTPVISGTAQEGQTLTAIAAVANNSATVTYQWQENFGSGYVNIGGATGLNYQATEADEGATLRIVANSADSTGIGITATSTATSAVTDHLTLTTPTISGTVQAGQVLTATAATSDNPDATITYQWEVNHGSGFAVISGATGLNYRPAAADVGGTLEVIASATDTHGGSTSATSGATATVTAASSSLSSVSIGTLPAGDSTSVSWNATVNAQTNQLIVNPSNQGTVTSSFATVTTNTSVTTVDSLTLGDQIFLDNDRSGTFNAGDTSIAGVTLTLFDDTNHDNVFDAGDTQIATTTTNAGGLYSFSGLAPGDYIVRVDQSNFNSGGALAGLLPATGGSDPDDNVDNDSNGIASSGNGAVSEAITLDYNTEPTAGTGNDTNDTLDFGFVTRPPPTLSVTGAGATYTETAGDPSPNGTPVAVLASATVADVSSTTFASATAQITSGFVSGNDLLSIGGAASGTVGGTTITYSYNPTTGLMTFTGTGTASDYQTALQSVAFVAGGDDPTSGADTSRTISFTVNDGTKSSTAATATVSVVGLNDPPTLTANSAGTTFTEAAGLGTQGAAVAVFSGATAGTVEAGQTIKALTFTVSGLADGASEKLSVDGTAITLGANSSGTTATNGMTYAVTISGGTATIALTKTAGISTALLDTLVNGVTYQNTNTDDPTAGARVFTLTQIQDNGGTANGGNDTATLSIAATVNVVATDDPPVNHMPGAQTATENAAHAITGLTVTDPDANALNVQVTLSVDHGILTLPTNVASGLIANQISGDTTGSVTLTGSLSEINATLGAVNGLVYQSSFDYSGADTLHVVSDDLGHTGSGGPLTTTNTVGITVNAAAATNTLTAVQSETLTVDNDGDGVADPGDTVTIGVQIGNNSASTAATGVTFSETLSGLTEVSSTLKVTPIAVTDSYSATGNTPLTVSAGSGVLANDASPDGGALTAINVVQSDAVTHGTVSVGADGSFTYTPDTGYSGTATFQYSAHDANGGNSNQAGTVTLTVGSPTWYVNSAAAPGGDGSSAHPFQTIQAAVTAAAADGHGGVGDTISVAAGSYSGAGITLASGEKLVGAGSGTTTFTVSSGNAVTLNSGNTISGIHITDSGSGAGITDNGSTVGTLHFANIAVTSGSGAGITLTHNGTVDATGTNTISTTSGTALDVANTNIGSANLTFQSISDGTGSGSSGDGIILDTTGSSGGLHVTGVGTTAGSGGTIEQKTGADGSTTSGIGIYLNSTSDVQLADMQLNDFQNFGIFGNNVNGFGLANSTVTATGSGTNGSASGTPFNEGSLSFDGLTGTASITNSTISKGITSDLSVLNTGNTGSALTLNISGSTFAGQGTTTVQELLLVAGQNAGDNPSITANITTSHFTNNDARDIQAITNSAASMVVNIGQNGVANSGGTFDGMPAAMLDLDHNSTGNYAFNVQNATFTVGGPTFASVPINIFNGSASGSASIFQGQIVQNSITGGNNGGFDGISLVGSGPGTLTALIDSNTITNVAANGISYTGAQNSATNHANLTITNNTITMPDPNAAFGVQVSAQASSAASATVEATITGNNVVNDTASPDYRVDARFATATLEMPGYTGGATDLTAIKSFVAANNKTNGATTTSADVSASAGIGSVGHFTNTPAGAATPLPNTATLTAPTVGATAQEGTPLTATAAIGDAGATITYQWQENFGTGYVNIAGATGLTYQPTEADIGATLRIVASEVDTDATVATATSTATSAVTDHLTLTTPTISGNAQAGQVLTTTAATSDNPDATITYQWEVNHGSGFAVISGATGLNYRPATADVGGTLEVIASATDTHGGSASATSGVTTTVAAASSGLSSVAIGTLPAGDTVTISDNATVNAQTNQLIVDPSNQGTVTSSFPTATTNTMDTTVDSLTLGDTVFMDNDASGTFNAGDTGIDGVAVTLYVDSNHDNIFDAGDTQIATTTTAGGGLYSFTGLAPGDYIVQLNQSNFGAGQPLAGLRPTTGGGDPDNNTDNDSNGIVSNGNGVVSEAITLAYNTEPTAGTGNDTNNTLDFGFVTAPVGPTAAADTYPVFEGATATGTAGTGVLANDSGTGLAVTAVNAVAGNVGHSTAGTYGELTLNADGSYSYVADQTAAINGAAGGKLTDTFNYTVTDSNSDSATTTVSFTVDRPPAAATHNVGVTEGGSTGTVSAGDTDPDGDTVNVTAITGGTVGTALAGTYGSLTINSNDTYSYTANNTVAINAAGGGKLVDTFTYTVSDGLGGTANETLSFTVDRPPAVATHNVSVTEGGSTGTVSAGDTDPDGDTVNVTALSGGTVGTALAGTYGSLTINANDTYSYSANNAAAINGAAGGSKPVDTFTYTVSDGLGGTTNETLKFTVDRPPAVATHNVGVTEGGSTGTVSAGDTDPDGDTVNVTALSGGTVGTALAGTYGSLTINANDTYSYTANNTSAINAAAGGSKPVDTFTYTVSDGLGGTTNETLSFAIDRPPTATVGTQNLVGTGQNFNLKGWGLAVSDIDGFTGIVTATLSVGTGVLTLTPGGSGVTLGTNATSSVTMTGTLAQIDALLETDSTSTVSFSDSSSAAFFSTPLTISVTANGLTGSSTGMINLSLNSAAAVPNASTADMIMGRGSDGTFEIYDFGKNAILASYQLGQISPQFQAVGVGDFDGTDAGDMLMRNPTTGVFQLYDVKNNTITGSVPMGQVGPEWSVSGFGDFSGNANETDMLMRNTAGAFELYDIANNNYTGFHALGTIGLNQTVAGFGDFSGNANETDMLMRDTTTGAFSVYDINHNQLGSPIAIGQVALSWQVAGIGDFSGNANETDILMRNSTTGAFDIYDVTNNQLGSPIAIGQVGPEWSVAGFGNFSGNAGETDMLMRNTAGAFEIYDINNNQFTGFHAAGQVGPEWQVSGISAGTASASQLAQAIATFAPSPPATAGNNQTADPHTPQLSQIMMTPPAG